MDPIELAAWTHAEFVKTHPFEDGNGRTSRLIMNYQLMSNGFLSVSIPKKTRLSYFDTLEKYALSGDLHPFADLIAQLEEKQLDRYNNAIKVVKKISKRTVQLKFCTVLFCFSVLPHCQKAFKRNLPELSGS